MTDARNGPPPPGLAPLVLFIMILGIGAALGMQTGAKFLFRWNSYGVSSMLVSQVMPLTPRVISDHGC